MSFRFKCKCNMRTQLVGDGCQKCNTSLAIDQLPTPCELSAELSSDAALTQDQAEGIVAEVYQPLLGLIKTLNEKVDELAQALNTQNGE